MFDREVSDVQLTRRGWHPHRPGELTVHLQQVRAREFGVAARCGGTTRRCSQRREVRATAAFVLAGESWKSMAAAGARPIMSAVDKNRWPDPVELGRLLATAKGVPRKNNRHDDQRESSREREDKRCFDELAHDMSPP